MNLKVVKLEPDEIISHLEQHSPKFRDAIAAGLEGNDADWRLFLKAVSKSIRANDEIYSLQFRRLPDENAMPIIYCSNIAVEGNEYLETCPPVTEFRVQGKIRKITPVRIVLAEVNFQKL